MRKRLFISLLFLCALLLSACAAQRAAPEASAPQETDTQAVSELDAFYQHPLAAAYGDVRKLDADYTAEQAQRDRCFVIGVTVHNDDLYTAFMANVEQRKDAFIRVVQTTVEGDPILYDILYTGDTDAVQLVRDASRDAFAAEADREITLRSFAHIAEYADGGALYWVAYDGAPDITGEDTFVIAQIR